MRVAFLGTPTAAVPSLEALVGAGHDVALVVTQPDRRRGRGASLSPSPVKAAAQGLGLPVSERLADVLDVGAELAVVVAYGRLIPAAMLDRLAMVNVHFSLLPRWRGAAPVERAILAGDERTGVCVMALEAGLDTGPVYDCRDVPVDDKDAASLTDELAELGAGLLVELLAGPLPAPHPQVGEPTYARKLEPIDFALDPTQSAVQLARVVRLGRAACEVGGRRLRVTSARALEASAPAGSLLMIDGSPALACAAGALVLLQVRPEGARTMAATDWWRGARLDARGLTWGPVAEASP